jgi:hypothetical protein
MDRLNSPIDVHRQTDGGYVEMPQSSGNLVYEGIKLVQDTNSIDVKLGFFAVSWLLVRRWAQGYGSEIMVGGGGLDPACGRIQWAMSHIGHFDACSHDAWSAHIMYGLLMWMHVACECRTMHEAARWHAAVS